MLIEDAYDKFHEVVAGALKALGESYNPQIIFKELDDNVIIENNDIKKLKNGFAIQFSGDSNTNTELSGITGMDQVAFVTFTTANFGTIRDIPQRKAAEKRLLAMKDAVVKAIGANPCLDDTVAKCIYNNTEPFELIVDDEEKVFLMIRSTYTIGYFE